MSQTAQHIYHAEEKLLLQSTGISGHDIILKKNIGSASFGAYALLRRGLLEDALLTLERGRAQSLAKALMIREAFPERIRDSQRREHYTAALAELRRTQNTLARMNTWNPTEYGGNQDYLATTNACAQAQMAFDAIVAEIRVAHDPADFLSNTIHIETIREAVETGGPGHALVYLVALPEAGGFAVAALHTGTDSQDRSQTSLRLISLDLPELTYELVMDLISRGGEDGASPIGGLAHAQDLNLVVSPDRFGRQKCSDIPCGCQAPPQKSIWTNH